MNWLRRRGTSPPDADPAPESPRSGLGPGGNHGHAHDHASPSSGPTAPSLEGAAPGITALLEGVDPGGGHSVLDLGRATGAKLDLYTPVARRMRFVDLLETGGAAGGGAGGATRGDSGFTTGGKTASAAGSGPGAWARAVAGIPAEPDHPYDLVLAWDILDRMPPEHHGALVARLAGVVRPKARLHLLVAASEASLPELFRFAPLGPGRLRYDPTHLPRPTHPRLHPAEVERTLEPFKVIRAFTLKVGFREFVAIRGSGPPAG